MSKAVPPYQLNCRSDNMAARLSDSSSSCFVLKCVPIELSSHLLESTAEKLILHQCFHSHKNYRMSVLEVRQLVFFGLKSLDCYNVRTLDLSSHLSRSSVKSPHFLGIASTYIYLQIRRIV